MLQQKKERVIPQERIPHLKKCRKCCKKWYETMLQKCVKCKYLFCFFCQIKPPITNTLYNWACSICAFINEEQYKIDLIQLENEVRGLINTDNWHKCTTCNIETEIKYNFTNPTDVIQFLKLKGLLTKDYPFGNFDENKPIQFSQHFHFCDTCLSFFMTPSNEGYDLFIQFFTNTIILDNDTSQTKSQIKNQYFSEFSTLSHSRNNTSGKQARLRVEKSRDKIKKRLTFEGIDSNALDIAINKDKLIQVTKDKDDNSGKQLTKTYSITSDNFTLYNQYPKNYNPITFEYFQQLKYLEQILHYEIQSFYYFIEMNNIFNRSLDTYMTNSNYNSNNFFSNLILFQDNSNINDNNINQLQQIMPSINNSAASGNNPFNIVDKP